MPIRSPEHIIYKYIKTVTFYYFYDIIIYDRFGYTKCSLIKFTNTQKAIEFVFKLT